MIAQSSAIKLKDFAVLQSHYEFEQPKKNIRDVQKIVEAYEIDIDFAHHNEDEDNTIHIFVKIGINQARKTLPGYKLLVEGVGIFSLNEKGLSKEKINNLKYYSTVSIIIGYLRNTLSGITASAPFGPYLLPAIDMQQLFALKGKHEDVKQKL
jgi:preprotein translocase subunit SecB